MSLSNIHWMHRRSANDAAVVRPAIGPSIDRFTHLHVWRQTLAASAVAGLTNNTVSEICTAVSEMVRVGRTSPEVVAAGAVALHEVSVEKRNRFGARMALGMLDDMQARLPEENLKLLFAGYVLSHARHELTPVQAATARLLLDHASWGAAAPEDSAAADAIWGDVHRLGHRCRRDNGVAFMYYMAACQQPVAAAHYQMGRWYHGIDATWTCAQPDPERAAQHYRIGADRGHSGCMTQLACLQLEGRIRGADTASALSMLDQAARRGVPEAVEAAKRLSAPGWIGALGEKLCGGRPTHH